MKRIPIIGECYSIGLPLWQCPPVLFITMGFVTIISMVGAALLTSRYFEEPEAPTVIIVSFIGTLFIIIGNAIIHGFSKVAEASRMKSEFVSIISHQMRTPISILKWTLESLQQTIKKPESSNDTDFYILNLQDATQRMVRLVNALLDVTRIESRALILQSEDIHLSDVLEKLVNNFERYAQASHVTLTLEGDITGDPLVHVDRQRIGMVIETFIDNAIRYTIDKGTVSILLKKEGAFMRLSVSDEGVGIPKNQQKNIFQKFFRAHNIMQHQTEGTGIDLFISKYIIEVSGGTIGFISEENKGSTFWFTLPIKK
ncbi:MAG: HAMP domain-containing sensor histidine kinase [Patescibacteria group bacterium]